MQIHRYLTEHRRAVRGPKIPPPALDHVTDKWIVVANQVAAQRFKAPSQGLPEQVELIDGSRRLGIGSSELSPKLRCE